MGCIYFLCIILFCNFGKLVHKTINENVIKECKDNIVFNEIFNKKNCKEFIERAVEPDERKRKDSKERNKHYFHVNAYKNIKFNKYYSKEDIVNNVIMSKIYFNNKNKKEPISSCRDAEKYIDKHGYLPWIILDTIDKIKKMVKERKICKEDRKKNNLDDKIIYECINLSHYISDMCTPLHINVNHDGRGYGQKGIHRMWESLIPKFSIKKYNIMILKNYYINKIEDKIFEELNNSYVLSEDILDKEEKLCLEYKKKYNDVKINKRCKTNKYAKFCSKTYNEYINNQINKAITLISYVFNKLIFI